MEEKDDYEVEAVEEKVEEDTPMEVQKTQAPQKQPSRRRSLPIPQIPADKIFKTITDRDKMKEAFHDETLEPHIHLAILILMVFILAIIIALIGI